MQTRRNTKLLVSPFGTTAAWVHPLDLLTGHYPQYDSWIDASDMDDDEFEALICDLARHTQTGE